MRCKGYRDNHLKYYVIRQLEKKIPKDISQFVPGVNIASPDKCEIKQR